MDARWYFQVMGEEHGPVSSAQLKALARSGRISQDTFVKKGPDGNWVSAASVQGLFDPDVPVAAVPSAPGKECTAQVEQWYYELGIQHGPVSLSELRAAAASGRITENTYVKKGRNGKWGYAARVPGLSFPDRLVKSDSWRTTNVGGNGLELGILRVLFGLSAAVTAALLVLTIVCAACGPGWDYFLAWIGFDNYRVVGRYWFGSPKLERIVTLGKLIDCTFIGITVSTAFYFLYRFRR